MANEDWETPLRDWDTVPYHERPEYLLGLWRAYGASRDADVDATLSPDRRRAYAEWRGSQGPLIYSVLADRRRRPGDRRVVRHLAAEICRLTLTHSGGVRPLPQRVIQSIVLMADSLEPKGYAEDATDEINEVSQPRTMNLLSAAVGSRPEYTIDRVGAFGAPTYLRVHPAAGRMLLGCVTLADFDPAWRTDTAVAVARGMYERGDFSGMPILADAIQDAGCAADTLLAVMRDPEMVWCRGCWIVDHLLGGHTT